MKFTKFIILISSLTFFIHCKKQEKDSLDFTPSTVEQKNNQDLISNEKTTDIGKEIFEGKGTCNACHLPDKKIIGPSIKEIANTYKAAKADMVKFLKEEESPIVDPSQYEIMKANFAITKKMKDSELKELENYILSFAD